MKEHPQRERDEDGDIIGEDFKTGMVDWRASPEQVLKAVDELLRMHRLEIHMFETGADFYEFTVKHREKA